MQTKTVQLKTNAGGAVSLAPPALHPGSHTDQGACVPPHLPPAAVLTASRTAAVDVSCDGPSRIAWEDLAAARPGQIVRTSSSRAAQRLIAASGSERSAHSLPRRRSSPTHPHCCGSRTAGLSPIFQFPLLSIGNTRKRPSSVS